MEISSIDKENIPASGSDIFIRRILKCRLLSRVKKTKKQILSFAEMLFLRSSRCGRTVYDIKKRCVRVSINDFVKHRSIEDDCPSGCFFSSIEDENIGDIFSITRASFTTNIFLNAKLSKKNVTGYS